MCMRVADGRSRAGVGKHRFSTELTLTRFGPSVGTVYVEFEINISLVE